MRIRVGYCALLIVGLLLVLPTISRAWEFTINSALLSFRFIYASQAGPNGFFGPFDTDMSSLGTDLASLNGWFQRRMLSGTTAVASSTRLVMFPMLKLNKAVSITGAYRIAPENTQQRETDENPELENVFSRGAWTRLWMKVETPLGRLHYGKRGFQQGCGLQFSSTQMAEDLLDVGRRTVEILQLETSYGPLTLGAGLYPWRRGSSLYWNSEDQNAARPVHLLSYVRYAAGQMDADEAHALF